MISEDKIIGIFCLVNDLLKGIGHPENSRRKLSDSEVITTAIVSALYGPWPPADEDDRADSSNAGQKPLLRKITSVGVPVL